MKECWPEGALRAYLDGELAPAEMQAVAAHLTECTGCERVHAELAGRAGYVAGLMGTLAEPRRAAARVSGSWRWTAAAVAVAAGLAVATVLVPRQEARKPAPAIPTVGPQVAEAPPPPVEMPRIQEARVAQAVPARAKVKPRLRAVPADEPFLALDDEPIESGIVMRVTVPGSTPADIVFSPDGRARAIRLVSGKY